MSDSVYVTVFYGPGNVIWGAQGVDLSQFQNFCQSVTRARDRPWSNIRKWLFQCFELDHSQDTITVQAVVNRQRDRIFFELLNMNGTNSWRQYLDFAARSGQRVMLFVQVHQMACTRQAQEVERETEHDIEQVVEEAHEVETEEVGTARQPIAREARGVLDEGEEIPWLVDQIDMEDEEHNSPADDEGSSDEEDACPLPQGWSSYDHSRLAMNPGENVPWEYKANEVTIGSLYSSKQEVLDAVKAWHTLSLQRQFRVKKSNQDLYEVRCVQDGCNFRLYASRGKRSDYWKVSRLVEHDCRLHQLAPGHRNLTADFVANFILPHIVRQPNFEPKSIICAVEENFKFKISYNKAYRAKRKALEKKWGTYEASYHNLPSLLQTICQRNPGSYYDIKVYPCADQPGKQVLQRAFLALNASIAAFKRCRPVICIDGTFLTGKYRGTILTAIGADGNTQVVPLAIAFVEKESGDSWYWFLERVKVMVVDDVLDVCLIHDRHKGILQAIDDLQNGNEERGRQPIWADVISRWCMRHMGANFHSQFKSKPLTKMFKRLCSQNQEKKFNSLWKRLDELTKKESALIEKKLQNSLCDEPVPLEDVGLDGSQTRRRRGRQIKTFSEWIENEPKEKWALLYDEGGARWGIMTTNLAEVYNWVLRGVRMMPLVGIIEFYLYRTIKYFQERVQKANQAMLNSQIVFGPTFTEYLEAATTKALQHRVESLGGLERKFEVFCRDKGRLGGRREKNLQEVIIKDEECHCTCSCHKPRLYHRPCSHVIAACIEVGGLEAARFVPHYFRKETIFQTWATEIYGYRVIGTFVDNPGQSANYIPDPSPEMFQGIGRRRKRIRNNMDEAEAGRDVPICSKCLTPGHTYKKCTQSAYGWGTEQAGPSSRQ